MSRKYYFSLESKILFLVSSLYLANAEVKPIPKHSAWWSIKNESVLHQREVFSVFIWTFQNKKSFVLTEMVKFCFEVWWTGPDERFITHELEFIIWFAMKGTFLLLINISSLGSHSMESPFLKGWL